MRARAINSVDPCPVYGPGHMCQFVVVLCKTRAQCISSSLVDSRLLCANEITKVVSPCLFNLLSQMVEFVVAVT